MRTTKLILAVGIIGAMATPASAFVWTFNDPINAGQEVPPSGSPASGTAVGTYDDITNALVINVNATGFLSARTGAHIHFAPSGSNGGVVFDLGVAGAGDSYNNVNTNFVLDETQESNLLARNYYVNIHTQNNPGGSIRGQLNPVPEPATMIALGLGSVAVLLRRKKK